MDTQPARERQSAALISILQTILPEYYDGQGGACPRENFVSDLKKGDWIAHAIANVLTPAEIEHGFAWVYEARGDVNAEMRATPVMRFLTDEQRARARAWIVQHVDGGHDHDPGSLEATEATA